MKNFFNIISLLSKSEKIKLNYLILLMFFVGVFEVVGVVSIFPFIGVLSDPNIIHENKYLAYSYHLFTELGVSSNNDYLLILGFLVLFILILNLCLKVLVIYLQTRFAIEREYSLGQRLMKGYLSRPYIWFLQNNTSSLEKNILSEVNQVTQQAIMPFMSLVTNFFIIIMILLFLIYFDPFIALMIGLILGGSYFLIFLLAHKKLSVVGNAKVKSNDLRYKTLNEAFSGVRELKISKTESIYLDKFSEPAKLFCDNQALANIIALLPRYGIEAISFGGLLVVILYFLNSDSLDPSLVIPTISLYAFAGYKLLPALQQFYNASTLIKFSAPAVSLLHKDLNELTDNAEFNHNSVQINLSQLLEFKNISYRYPGSDLNSLVDISFNITANSSTGIIGPTGSGKSTLVNILVGLISADSGTILLDNHRIKLSDLHNLSHSVGYVPQDVFLIDATIARNIAFGSDEDAIDYRRLVEVVKIADIYEYVMSLELNFDTLVGQRGVRLSGGQRQRIGIARALYSNPSIIILDEGTSALDITTESKVISNIRSKEENLTIIMIAHRLSTLKNCDQLLFLDQGRLVAKGDYESVVNKFKSHV